jgi:hypothetical protein
MEYFNPLSQHQIGQELTASRILHNIIDNDEKDYIYIILGRSGATGKTSICNDLKRNGFTAFEISENIYNLVNYNDYKNHVVVDKLHKQVIIVLNRPLSQEV